VVVLSTRVVRVSAAVPSRTITRMPALDKEDIPDVTHIPQPFYGRWKFFRGYYPYDSTFPRSGFPGGVEILLILTSGGPISEQ